MIITYYRSSIWILDNWKTPHLLNAVSSVLGDHKLLDLHVSMHGGGTDLYWSLLH